MPTSHPAARVAGYTEWRAALSSWGSAGRRRPLRTG